MPKRKRDVGDERSSSHAHKAKRVDDKIFHGKRTLERALKLAKRFERQKLSRRHKNAVESQNDSDVARIEREIEALKALDVSHSAESHLYKSLLKDKRVQKSPALPGYVPDGVRPVADDAVANVTARLYNSNQVKDAMSGIMFNIRAAMGIFDSDTKDGRSKTATNKWRGDPDGSKEATKAESVQSLNGSRHENDLESQMSVEDGDRATSKRITLDSKSDNQFESFDRRVASSAGSTRVSSQEPDATARPNNYDPAADLSLSPSVSRSPSPPPLVKGQKKAVESLKSGNSAFLPSLTMGGYVSGSESEAEDDIPELASRKNRRGQRARQAIWEKKHGARAKHLQTPQGGTSRDSGWDAKRGALEGGRTWGQQRFRQGVRNSGHATSNGAAVASGDNARPIGQRRAVAKTSDAANKPLHPSWEAAKKAKEAKQGAAFSGKKIVFD